MPVNKQLGLLEDDITYNLSLLAVNVLQPVKTKFPNVVVVSGFRQTNTGIGQHELGQAVDLQIKNQTPEQLLTVADYIAKHINFDQLILNWTDIGDKQGWIHVSFSSKSLRGQVLTKDLADTFHEGLSLCTPLKGEAAAAALRSQAASDNLVLAELSNQQSRQERFGKGVSAPSAIAVPGHVEAASAVIPDQAVTGTIHGKGFGFDDIEIQSSLDVRDWKITTNITSFHMLPGVLSLSFDKQNTWPSVDIGGGTLIQYSLWTFINVENVWWTACIDRLRPQQTTKPLDQKFSNWMRLNWMYDKFKFGKIAGYTPKLKEQVGFMVTQGSLRQDSRYTVPERSDILWVHWPADFGSFTFN